MKLCLTAWIFMLFSPHHVVLAKSSSILVVPLVRLLIKSDDYKDKLIKTMGFLNKITPMQQTRQLYLTHDHALAHDIASSVNIGEPLSLRKSDCGGSYVYIIGNLVVDKYRQSVLEPNKIISEPDGKVCWRNSMK